ncbi:MAG TPA: hypothetical protein VNG71_16095 [Pyrinomonadaceae bacterium]|nr:hypothetical protein [Pyrinomonadaceae bacterium]
MSRKSLWLGLMLAIFAAAMVTLPASAKPKKKKVERRSGPPTISLMAEPSVIKACADEGRVQLTTNGRSETGQLRYRWTVSAGRLRGDGPSPIWDLGGAAPGVYQAIVDVDDGDANCVAFSSLSVVVLDCPPPPPEKPVCPTVSVSCPEAATENAPVTFTANLSGGTAGITPTYNWTISAGRIISGQGTPSITVDTTGLAGQTVRATLDIGGFGMPCPASCAVAIPIVTKPHKFDEYYDIARNDEKARLDNYAIEIQQQPGSLGYVIVYPSRKAGASAAQARAQRIVDYLVNTRGLDSHRVVTVMGPAREDWLFELWVVPEGAPPPVPQR